jgi:eukaryotic-like serine/threonine-protein kinase
VGSQDRIDFLVMEYLEGETLEQRLKKGALPLDQALQIGIQIADALAAAHRAGITHRDLKPGNIMLTKSGAKLLDFGLAKLRPASPVSMSGMTRVSTMAPGTASGTILGTVHYMAPEQVEGRDADGRSDIWAFGCVLYEVVTGTRPFNGDTPASVIGSILRDTPRSPSMVHALVPAALDRLVSICLEKDPEARWQSAGDLRTELKWIAEGATTVGVASRTYRNWSTWIAMAFCVATIAPLIRYVREQPVPTERVEFVIVPPEDGAFSCDGLSGSNIPSPQLAVAPAGRRLAFIASTADGRPRLWVRSFDAVTARPLAGTEGAARPFWSPDGRYIGFFAGAKLKTIPADGGPVQVLCDAANPRGGTWSQDGVIVFSPSFGDGLYRVSVGDGPTAVTRLDTARQELSHRWPQFLPDGRHFLYLAMNARFGQAGIYIGSLDSAETERILDTDFRAEFVAGYLLFVREGTLLAQPFDATARRLAGDAVPLADRVGSGQATGEAAFSASTGALAHISGIEPPLTQLTWVGRDGQPRGVIGAPGEYENPVLSADNQRVAVHRIDPALGTDVWLMDAVHGSPSRFTFDAGIEFAPVWSPDSRTIAFSSNRTGTFGVYQKPSSGGEEELVLDTTTNGMFLTGWSTDRRFLVYTQAGPKTEFDVSVLPLFGDRKPLPFLQSIANETQGQFTADGQLMAYTSDETGTPEVFVQPFPATGAKWQVSSGGGSDPQWRRDGLELFYISPDGTLIAAQVKRGPSAFDVGIRQSLFRTRRPVARGPLLFSNYAPAANGQRFLINAIATEVSSIPITVALNWMPALQK